MDSPYILVDITAHDVDPVSLRTRLLGYIKSLLFFICTVAFLYWVYWISPVLPQRPWG
jgi:hypothetical protein